MKISKATALLGLASLTAGGVVTVRAFQLKKKLGRKPTFNDLATDGVASCAAIVGAELLGGTAASLGADIAINHAVKKARGQMEALRDAYRKSFNPAIATFVETDEDKYLVYAEKLGPATTGSAAFKLVPVADIAYNAYVKDNGDPAISNIDFSKLAVQPKSFCDISSLVDVKRTLIPDGNKVF